MKKKIMTGAALLFGFLAGSEMGASAYFYRRTMKRGRTDVKRTMKMAGTDWNQYMPMLEKRKESLLSRPHEEIFIRSEDGLKLHASFFPNGENRKIVICLHGYTSQGISDYVALSDYYLKKGFAMLLPDARAHGQSEGEYIGFGCLDRHDLMGWISWAIGRSKEDVQILLHGTSMGGATVLMASGLDLPRQVKGIVSDCGFTSPKEVFTHVLHTMYHLPSFPMIQIADRMNRRKAGYGLDECNAAREVEKAKVPILMIHGSADTFVPSRMCEEIYEHCASPKKKLIVEGAAHAESYCKASAVYERTLDEWIGGILDDEEKKRL